MQRKSKETSVRSPLGGGTPGPPVSGDIPSLSESQANIRVHTAADPRLQPARSMSSGCLGSLCVFVFVGFFDLVFAQVCPLKGCLFEEKAMFRGYVDPMSFTGLFNARNARTQTHAHMHTHIHAHRLTKNTQTNTHKQTKGSGA